MNIASILDTTVEIAFDYTDKETEESATITAVVQKECLTPGFGQMLLNLDNNKDYDGLANELAVVTRSWDIDYNGEPFPPIVENLRRVPIDFLVAFLQAITEQWAGKSKSPKPSDSGLARAARSRT